MKQIIIMTLTGVCLLLSSCTKTLTGVEENHAPVLVKAVNDISTKVNTPITIRLRHIEAYDDDGDVMTIELSAAQNCTISGTTVIPATSFIGDLFIPVRVFDGKLYSQQKIMIVSVVNTVELFPLITGSWWEYRDSVPANDSVFISKMTADWSRDSVIDSRQVRIFNLQWTNLAEYGIIYDSYTSSTGTVLLGGKSPVHEIVSSQLLYRYPLTKGETWGYRTLNYNATDSLFYLGDSANMTCTETSVFVEVPAGVFECIEMTHLYTEPSGITPNSTGSGAGGVGTVVEKLYYSPGVGYVKNITTVDNRVVWIKELTDYFVEEEQLL